MGFMSHRQKNVEIRPEQKWDYITLNDFKSTSCFTPLAYGYLYFSLILSVAVYAVDTFTAVNLLVFNKWSSEFNPTISFTAAKWIFSVCIILSIVNLLYEHIRAQTIMRRGSVAECYLDNLAVRLESVRWGKGNGWKRFLVFAELTKSKKGAEYIALFTFFNLQSWIRVLLCSGPRQVVNALTLYSVYNAKLSATGTNVENTLLDFFAKIRALALENYQQALILSGMLFTLVIWVFAFLSLLLSFAFFVFFLWGYIPNSDGGLSGFCSRKINKRLMKIVSVKVNKALEEEERRRKRAEFKAAKKAGGLPPTELTATIPDVGDDKLQPMPMMHRNDTMTSLPPYTSRPGTAGSFELNAFDQKRPSGGFSGVGGGVGGMPLRSATMASVATSASTPSTTNFSARAPLLGYAAEPGVGGNRAPSPTPSVPRLSGGSSSSGGNYAAPSLMRNGTATSNHTLGRTAAAVAPPPPLGQLGRTNSSGSIPYNRSGSISGNGYAGGDGMPTVPQAVRSPVGPYNGQTPPFGGATLGGGPPNPYPNQYANQTQTQTQNQYPSHQPNGSFGSNGRYAAYRPDDNSLSSPAPSGRAYGPYAGNGYPAPSPRGDMMSPMRSATNPMPVSPRTYGDNGSNNGGRGGYGSPYAPQRNMTAPMPPTGSNNHGRQYSEESSYSSYFEQPQSATASSQRGPPRRPSYGNAWNTDAEAQRGYSGGRY
ncbi:hypothetical protein SPI_05134 [Niveomyces insectorum RCEF 264]|uniref:Pheromone-regulated membrane protein n=1 Tax=Niveomyces insectorum RCEF 264 TaxID=1081102 RepID=A0A167TZE7_9HYPO|nr:hypothetical protein SPI_05134 [Niveomyces insectorum RCEF 264]